MISPTPEQILKTASYYFEKGRCSGHHQFNGRYCRDAAGPDRWCIHCAGLLLLSLLDQRDAEIAELKVGLDDPAEQRAERYALEASDLTGRLMNAEASLLRMTEERDSANARFCDEHRGVYKSSGCVVCGLMTHGMDEKVLRNEIARLAEAHEQLQAISVKWRSEAMSIEAHGNNWNRATCLENCADDLDALLAPPEEKKDDGSSPTV